MKLFRYIFFVGAMITFFCNNVAAQSSPNCKSSINSSNSATSFCGGKNLLLWYGDTSSGKKFYQWYTGSYPKLKAIAGQTKPQHIVTTADTFYVRVIDTANQPWDTGYCFKIITVNPQPSALFTANPAIGCGSTKVFFTSTGNNVSGTVYSWTFGDNNNNTANTVNASHTYVPPASGAAMNYTVTFIVKNASSTCSDTATKTISVAAGPDADFNITGTNVTPILNSSNIKVGYKICSPNQTATFTFTNQSSTTSTNTKYQVSWGDGYPDTIINTNFTTLTHKYSVGLYSLSFTVTNPSCVNTLTYKIFLGTNPAVGIGSPGNTDICTPATLTFPIDTSTANKNPPGTTYIVHFNDGSTDTAFDQPPPASVTHTFNNSSCGTSSTIGGANAFYAQITATNPCKTTDAYVTGITVTDKPKTVITGTGDTTCINNPVTLTNTGNIQITPYGSSSCNSGNVVWDIQPTTGWTLNSGSLGNDNGSNIATDWTTGTLALNITFTTVGSFSVLLRAGGSTCNYDSVFKTICVNPTPTAAFTTTKDSLCAGDDLNFTNTSTAPNCGINIYSWAITPSSTTGCSFANSPTYISGTTAISANPVLNFNAPGSYDVSLTTTIKGTTCTSTPFTKTITVKDKPTVTLNVANLNLCLGDSLQPTVNASCYTSNATYSWTFSNAAPASSVAQTPGTIYFNNNGTSNISVDVTNVCGTTNQSKTVTINPKPTVDSVPNFTLCAGDNFSTLAFTGTLSGTTYNWTRTAGNIGLATLSGNASISSFTAANATTSPITVTITVTPTKGSCNGIARTFTITVKPQPTVNNIANIQACANATIAAINFAGNIATATYNWTNSNTSIGLAANGTADIAAFTGTNNTFNPITANIAVTPTLSGCNGVAQNFTIQINPVPTITDSAFVNPSSCGVNDGSITLKGLNNGSNYTINYTFGGSPFSVNQTASSGNVVINNIGAGTYTNIYVTYAGFTCKSNSINTITLTNPTSPTAPAIGGVDTICSGNNLTLNVVSPISGATYTWTNPLGSTSNGTSLAVNNITTAQAGNYSLIVTVNNCPSNPTVKKITVNQTPSAPLTSPVTYCQNATATPLTPNGSNYIWYNNAALTNGSTTAPTPVTTSVVSTTYYVADSNNTTGCKGSASSLVVTVNATPVISFKDDLNPNQCATPTGYIRLDGLNPNTIYTITYTVGGNTVSQSQTSDASGVLKVDTLRAGTYSNIYVTLNGCPSNKIGSYTLLDPNPPATPTIIGLDSICSGSSYTLQVALPVAVGTYTWTHPNGSTATGVSYTIANIHKPDSGVFKLNVTINLCKSRDTTFNVRVDSTPLAPTISSNSPVCTDSTIRLFANSNHPFAVSYNWTGANSFSSTQQNPTISNATIAMAGNYNAYITSVAGKCQSASSATSVAINPTPNVVQLNDTTYKDGANSGNIVFTGTVANTVFNWTNSNTNIGLAASGTGTINFNATNTTPFQIFGDVTVTPSTNFCVGKSIAFKIYVNPTATLSSKLKDTICTDNLYTYQATSITPNVKYTWSRVVVAGIANVASSSTDSTGAFSETLTNTTTQPIDVTYNFKLYAAGTISTVPFVLTVAPNAKANYTYTNDKLCAPAYIDTSIIKVQDFLNANSNYEWYANGVLIGTGINSLNYTIANTGDSVIIKLKAISAFGCKPDSFEHKFYTVVKPTVSFTKSINKGCGPLSVSFTNNSTPLNQPTYLWNFGNGQTSTQQSPSNIIFNSDTSKLRHDTTYYISLTAYTQCDTIKFIDSVTVFPKPRALYQPDTTVGCSVFHFTAFNNSLGTHNTYTWDYDDNTFSTDTVGGYIHHNFTTSKTDTFTVKLTASNTCGIDSFKVNIVVFPNTIVPKLIVDGNNNYGCAPQQVRFINNTIGANKFTVNFGDGSLPYISNNNPDTIYHTYQNAGTFTATMKAENGCTDSTISLTLVFYPKPTALFNLTPNQFCKKQFVHFTNGSDTALSFEWRFGDGSTSTNLHPTHQYLTAGNYTVTLIAKSTNATGAVCTDTLRKPIVIHDLPVSSFTDNAALQNCQPYNFIGSTLQPAGNINNWIFVDPTSVDTTQAGNVGNHIFYNVGLFTVKLIVLNPYGCSDTASTVVKVIETPKAKFAMTDTISCTPGKGVNFTNQSTYNGTDALNYQWYINGVLTATTKNFFNNFTASSNITTAVNFTVKMVVTNSYGCKDSTTKHFAIIPKAQPSFVVNALQGCVPFNLQFNNTSQYANIFKWYLDGNLFSSSASTSPINLTIPANAYTIKLVADNTLGCGADSTVKTFNTYTKPVAAFQLPVKSACTGKLTITCFDQSFVVGANIKKWTWNFGDGTSDTARNPVHTYLVAGRFNVSLIVQDDRGCSSDYSVQTVTNFGKPHSNFVIGNACINNPAIPVNLSTPGFGSTSITSYLWNFGDGNLATGVQPVNVYKNEGIYTVTLITTADSSCVADTFAQQITVYGKPVADFNVANNCVKEQSAFTNSSLFGFGQTAIGTSKWNFGDGANSANQNPTHIYNAVGDYVVRLAVTGNRCPNLVDSIKKTITIHQPRISISYPRLNGVRGVPLQLNALNGGVSYNWLPTIGLNNSGIQNPFATYGIAAPNIINYSIKIKDSLGCFATDTQQVWLFVDADIFLPTAFTPNGDGANDLFKPLYVNINKINTFKVFDRWGKVVFETSDMGKSWDGTLNGNLLPMDTYTWIVSGYTNDGKQIDRKGNVTLIKN